MWRHKNWIPRHSAHSGFTIVEILTVLAILALLVGMSTAALSSYLPQADLKRASRTIVGICQKARNEAIKRNSSVAVVFDNATQSCTLYVESGDGNWGTVADNVALNRFSLSEIHRGGVAFGFGPATKTIGGVAVAGKSPFPTNARFVFTGSGRVNTSGTTYVTNSDRSLAVTVRNSGSVITRSWGGGEWK